MTGGTAVVLCGGPGKAGLPPPTNAAQSGLCCWQVQPTGDWSADCDIDSRLALEYLEAGAESHAPSLQRIVADMPRGLTGVEVGFLSVIRAAATADKNAGRRYVERGIANQVWYELQVIWLRHARRRQRAARSS